MTLTLVTPPTQVVVEADQLLSHRRLEARFDLPSVPELVAMEQAAVAYLDGYRGILGRAIMPQVWKQEFPKWGTLRLAMPDVSAIKVTGLDASGATVTATKAELRLDSRGPYVITEGPAAERVFVEFTCSLPMQQLPAVQTAIKMLVGYWFEDREGQGEVPTAVNALIAPLRWRQA